MNRPWPLRIAPAGLRVSLYYRFYRARAARRPGLYAAASLAAAPGVRMRLEPGDEIHDCIAYTGLYEAALTQCFMRHARQGGLLVDVGANYGYFSLLWAAAASGNRVVAFEPSPRNVAGLRRNVENNGFGERIRVDARAASRACGKMAFDFGPAEQTGWGGAVRENKSGAAGVPAVRLDEALAGERCIDVLKIDVEGAEPWVLEGATALLCERRVKQIFFEVNEPRLAALGLASAASETLLRAAGYEVAPLGDTRGEVREFSAVLRAT